MIVRVSNRLTVLVSLCLSLSHQRTVQPIVWVIELEGLWPVAEQPAGQALIDGLSSVPSPNNVKFKSCAEEDNQHVDAPLNVLAIIALLPSASLEKYVWHERISQVGRSMHSRVCRRC
jgi:hypothetical protein